MTKPRDIAKYISVDVSSTRLNRIWAAVAARLPVETRLRWWPRVAVAAALTLGVVLLTWRVTLRSRPQFPLQQAIFETAGDASSVELIDGSRLELAARTRLEWTPGDARSLAVRLMHGSVVCDLVSRRDRKFSVFAADVQVQVTGTRFTVSYNPKFERVDVAVQRGSVSVTTASGSEPGRRLAAGERWSVNRGSSNPVDAQAIALTTASASPPAPDSSSQANPAVDEVQAPGSGGHGEAAVPVVQDFPSARSLLDQGNAARRTGDARGAANAYQTLLTKFPRDPRAGLAAFELGRLRMGPLADIPGAVRAFQSAIALSPGSAIKEDSMAHLVEAYAASGQTAQCVSARVAYLDGYPNGVHAGRVRRQCGVR